MTISRLPPEIMGTVLDNLDSQSLLRFSCSCYCFYRHAFLRIRRTLNEDFLSAVHLGDTQLVGDCLDRYYSRLNPPSCSVINYGTIEEALVIASENEILDIMETLLSRESLLIETGFFSGSPLAYAAQDGRAEAVRLLLSYGADPDRSQSGRLPVQLAANEHIRRMLICHAGAHTLEYLVETDSVNDVRYMLEHNGISNDHQEPLEIAARRNNHEMVDVLLLYGFRNSQGAFVRAIRTGNLKLVTKLARDPNEECEGERPLHHAVQSSSA